MSTLPRATRSVCPVCLKTLPAVLERGAEKGTVLLTRRCPEHGEFSAPVWRGEPDFEAWSRPKSPTPPQKHETERALGCPRDCGRCNEHRQHSCTVLLEITGRCNLRCPVCFASSGGEAGRGADFAPLEELTRQLEWIHQRSGDVVLQLSGGEPTLYPDLAALTARAAAVFPAVQLNTNGILLGQKPELAARLAEAGLSWVFLQFDGCSDDIYRVLRGRALMAEKEAALESCRKAGLSVVLVPTLARGVNDADLGGILDFALEHAPTVRGIHLQPMAVMGRNSLEASGGLTMPEALDALARQSGGRIRPEHAAPPGCEHERCSFHMRYRLRGRELTPAGPSACCSGKGPPLDGNAHGARKAISSVIRNWQGPASGLADSVPTGEDALSRFIRESRSGSFSITCMAFQDARTLDLDRLQGCCVHVYAPAACGRPERLVPFCAYNLTALDGTPLHRAP